METLTTLNTVDAKVLDRNPPIVIIGKASFFVIKNVFSAYI